MTYTDQLNRRIAIAVPPQRIISTVPSQTELLFWLGLKDNIVGITKFCIHPKELCDTTTKIGGTKKLDIEKIRMLKPDLIIANKEENEQEQIETLAKEFPVWISDVNDLDGAYAMIQSVGEMTGTENKAAELIEKIKSDFAALALHAPFDSAQGDPNRSRRVAYLIWRKPYMTVGSDTFINDMLQRCGFVNIFAGKTRYPEISADTLIAAKPEMILLSSEPYPFKEQHIQELQAICPSAKVLLVDGEMFSWYGSRLLEAVGYFKTITD